MVMSSINLPFTESWDHAGSSISHGDHTECASVAYRMALCVSCVHNGVAGWCPWSWTRQMRLWQDVYQHHHSFPMEKWDDRLGMHTHEDGTLKPVGQVFKDIAMLMSSISFQASTLNQG